MGKMRECLPLCIILRERLKYALTNKECMQICMERCVKVDGKVRTDHNFPAGFMDVVELEKCRVNKVFISANKVPVAVTHDGRTIRYPDPDVKVNDTIKVAIATGKMSDILKFEHGAMCMLTGGRNAGRIGQLMHVEKHDGSFSIVTIKDTKGNVFATRLGNVFIIGAGNHPQVTLPKGRGIKKTILQERAEAEARGEL